MEPLQPPTNPLFSNIAAPAATPAVPQIAAASCVALKALSAQQRSSEFPDPKYFYYLIDKFKAVFEKHDEQDQKSMQPIVSEMVRLCPPRFHGKLIHVILGRRRGNAEENLVDLLLMHPDFRIDVAALLPEIKQQLDQKKISKTGILYLLCHVISCGAQSPLERSLIDQLIPFLYEHQEHAHLLRTFDACPGRFMLIDSARRLKGSGGVPPNLHYALKVAKYTSEWDHELRQWLIAPFISSNFYETVASLCCQSDFNLGFTITEINELIDQLSWPDLFRLGVQEGLHAFARRSITTRVFENNAEVIRHAGWVDFLRKGFIPCLNIELEESDTLTWSLDIKAEELNDFKGLLRRHPEELGVSQIETIRKWFTPHPELSTTLCQLSRCVAFPLLWDLLRPATDRYDPELLAALCDVAYRWPKFPFPDQLMPPSNPNQFSLVEWVIYAAQFPDSFSAPAPDPQRIVNALNEESEDNFGCAKELEMEERYQKAFWLLLAHRDEAAVQACVRNAVPAMLQVIQDCAEITTVEETNRVAIYTVMLQLLAEITQNQEDLKTFTPVLKDLIKYWKYSCFSASVRYISPFLEGLAKLFLRCNSLDNPVLPAEEGELLTILQVPLIMNLEDVYFPPGVAEEIQRSLITIRKFISTRIG